MEKCKKYIVVPGDCGYYKEDLIQVDAYIYTEDFFIHKSLHNKNKWVVSCNRCGRQVFTANGSLKQLIEKFENSKHKTTYFKIIENESFKVLVNMYEELKSMKGVN